MSRCTDLKEPEAVLATQELLVYESVDISDCLGGKFDKSACLQKPTTVNEIEQRERDRIQTRQSTAWSVNVYRVWDEYRSSQIETLGDKYRSVPVDLGTTPVEDVKLLAYKIHIGGFERWWQAVPVPVLYILISMTYFLISMLYIEHANE